MIASDLHSSDWDGGAKSPNVGCIGAEPKNVLRVGPSCCVDQGFAWLEALRFDHVFRLVVSIDFANTCLDGKDV